MQWAIFIPALVITTLAIGVETLLVMRDHPVTRRAGLVALIGIVAFPAAIVLHNALSAVLGEDEGITFIVALLVAPAAITIGVLGVALALHGEPRSRALAAGFGLAGGGLAVFAAYSLFALVITTLSGGNPPYQSAVEVVALTLSGFAFVGGALVTAYVLLRAQGTAPATR